MVVVVVTTATLKAVADMILAYAAQAQEIGHVTSPEIVASGREG